MGVQFGLVQKIHLGGGRAQVSEDRKTGEFLAEIYC
jgi:hypothetical protein